MKLPESSRTWSDLTLPARMPSAGIFWVWRAAHFWKSRPGWDLRYRTYWKETCSARGARKMESEHPYYLRDSKTGDHEGYSTLDSAREALLAWIFLQRGAGETVVEQDNGQWSD